MRGSGLRSVMAGAGPFRRVVRGRCRGVAAGVVAGDYIVGGLVGLKWRYASLIESYAAGDVSVGCREGGGLMGWRALGYVRATYTDGFTESVGGQPRSGLGPGRGRRPSGRG